MRKLIAIGILLTASSFCRSVQAIEVGADFLYWKTFQDDMDVAALVVSSEGGDITTINSNFLTPNFNPHSGFRFFVDFCGCHTPWNVEVSFTRVTSDNSRNFGTDAISFIAINAESFPIFTFLAESGFLFSNLDLSWSSSVNYLDIDIGHALCFAPCFELYPHMGLRGMWISERLGISGFTPSNSTGVLTSLLKQKYQGYGLEAGLDGYLHFGHGFSLCGQLGGSLLYAQIAVKERMLFVTPPGTLRIPLGPDPIWHLTPTVDGFIGIQYNNDAFCHPFEFHIGWEQHIVFDANHLKLIDYADLHLQGLTLGGSITY